MIAIKKSPTKDNIDKYILALIIVQYVEDITWLRRDTKFLLECWKYFTSERSERVKYFFRYEKRNEM